MTKLTKSQLVAEIEALRSQLNTQHEINRRLIGDMATARALIANAQPSPNLVRPAGYWLATVECDDEYGNPTAKSVKCDTEEEAKSIGDFGYKFVATPVVTPTPTPTRQAVKHTMPDWQIARGNAMAAAKAQAMKSGSLVMVQS